MSFFRKAINEFRYTNIKYRCWKIGKHLKFSVLFFLILVMVLSVFIILELYIFNKISLQEFVNNFILTWTALIVLFYVLETHKLKEEAAKQNRMAIHPLLMVYLKEVSLVKCASRQHVLTIKNIGEGIAFQPKINKQNIDEDENYNYWYEYKINEPLILPGQEHRIEIEFVKYQKQKKNNVPTIGIGKPLISFSQHKYFKKGKNFPLKIEYKDLEKDLHYSEIIVKPKRRTTVLFDFNKKKT